MRGVLVLIGLAGAATLAAIATPLGDLRAPVPRTEDVGKLEALLAARISTGIWAPRNPPGASPSTPDRARPLDQYVRHYAVVTLRSEEDLPFTTIVAPTDDASEVGAGFAGRRIAGVLVLESLMQRPAGIVLTHRRDALPEVVHQGCAVVNVVYDPQIDRLVSVWCNVG